MSASATTTPISANAPSCYRRRRDAAALDRPLGRPDVTNPWIAKYIFPGGYIPALSEVLPAVERAGLLVTDIEILRLHYAETLRDWRERFLAHREEAERIYDAALRADVGVLSGRRRNGVPRAGHDGDANPARPSARAWSPSRATTSRARRRACARSKSGQRPPLRLAGE